MRYFRLLLFPFSLLYGLVIAVRHWLYDLDFFSRTAAEIPTIVVGNLAVGGTGKSPMVEYLIRMLQSSCRVAVLSRGYGRRTKGYREVQGDDDASLSGDEPLQIKRKFPHITVAVCEKRVVGVRQLQDKHDLILLDDAFQHRALIPGFSILLFDYHTTLRDPHLLLPAGNYRDLSSRRKYADIMVVTKTPHNATAQHKDEIANKLYAPNIPLLFSQLHYDGLLPMLTEGNEQVINAESDVLVVTGIANPAPFLAYIQQHYRIAHQLEFPDHHAFTAGDISRIISCWARIGGTNKIMITTEKDSMRLRDFSDTFRTHKLQIFYMPIRSAFELADEAILKQFIGQYLQGQVKEG